MPRQAVVLLLALFSSIVLAAPAMAQGGCCVISNNGAGTGSMPPLCSYNGLMQIVDGLNNATINIEADLGSFVNTLELVGGNLGGTQATFDAELILQMTGTGDLDFFSRTIFVPIAGIFDFGPRALGDAVQTFPGDVVTLSGAIFGDPDFDLIIVSAGTNFGMPGPGETTLTRIGPPGDAFEVESFFDVFYSIQFSGADGSVLQNQAGTTRDTKRFEICSTPTSVPGPVFGTSANWGEIKQLFR